LLPALDFLHEEVVSLVNLLQLCIHPALEVDIILPRLAGITRVLVAFTDNFIQMSQGNLGHKRLLD
jgi:hypothetical protein